MVGAESHVQASQIAQRPDEQAGADQQQREGDLNGHQKIPQ